ncbi:GNAT family N-acetyltransferase [Streptomyces harbinensis]|uniref:GNAT family N-acetyltransferase n=1 Tax=Streptomyces harbinensis TaxID=1176198 RepID=UPI003716553F
MEARHTWPLYGLRLTTPRLELSVPGLDHLAELAEVAAGGLHEDGFMPFSVPWSATSPRERARGTFQHLLGTIATWQPSAWTLSLAVRHEGRVIGRQDLITGDYPVTREAETGSWLGLAHQGRGLGTEMRAAALHLAFAELDARSMTSAAMTDNPRSLGVSRKLGYRDDGVATLSVQGRRRTLRRLRIDRDAWEAHRTVPVTVEGLSEECRELFGLR